MHNSFQMTKETQKELNGKSAKTMLLFLIIGGILLVAYIVLSVVIETVYQKEESWLNALLYGGAILFGIGLVMTINIKKTDKKADLTLKLEYEISESGFVVKKFSKGEEISQTKLYFKDFIKYRETERFIFLYDIPVSACPFEKATFKEGELEVFKSYIRANNTKLAKKIR